MRRKIPYGIMNYSDLVEKNAYFIDKTKYIANIEKIENPVFLRPRRFGKSLFCSMLQYYYDLCEGFRFDELFGQTWIGQNKTGNQNKYIVLKLDFSTISPYNDILSIESSFNKHVNNRLNRIKKVYPEFTRDILKFEPECAASDSLSTFLDGLDPAAPKVFVIIDEYDNFVNQLITTSQDLIYRDLTTGESFLRTFFKVLKSGRQTGVIANIFITGVLPITMDDLTSAYNIADFITLNPLFEGMLGFTQEEVDRLLDQVLIDYEFLPGVRNQVDEIIKSQYNGYHFVNPDGAPLYNSTMFMYFLKEFCSEHAIPDRLIDRNLRTDLAWIRRLTRGYSDHTEEFVSQLTTQNSIQYNQKALVSEFNVNEFFEPIFYPISLFYLGMLTLQDKFLMRLPNLSMKEIVVEYFNELFRIDLKSENYEDLMREFVNDPDIAMLFGGYWERYVSQLPDGIFQKVNENFYRTTFYELCSRYLSHWFTWNIERSYSKGRSDLEFVGKYHEKFAGMRWVIEFKYLSNKEFHKFKCSPDQFQIQEEDRIQIEGYVRDLMREYRECLVRGYVIYCFGNEGYKIYEI